MEPQDQAASKSLAWHATLAGVLLASSGWCAMALAATNTELECDQLSRDMTRLEPTLDALTVDAVDHIADAEETESLDPPAATNDAGTPMLYLTPRVAAILKEVFGAPVQDAAQGVADAESSEVAAADNSDEPETADVEEAEKTAPVTLIDKSADLPQFHRQMYRNDI